jgi:hypothetical protein
MERLEQFEPNYVHILPTTQKENDRHNVTITHLGAESYRKVVKKYFKTLERLEKFEPKSVHILLSTHKRNCRHNVTLPPLGAGL